jgi:hypothetical protein
MSTMTWIERCELTPTVTMLKRFVETSGNDLVVMAGPRRCAPTMEALRARRNEVLDAVGCFDGSNVRVFGSVARRSAAEESDFDLLIDVPAGAEMCGSCTRSGDSVVNDGWRRLGDIQLAIAGMDDRTSHLEELWL